MLWLYNELSNGAPQKEIVIQPRQSAQLPTDLREARPLGLGYMGEPKKDYAEMSPLQQKLEDQRIELREQLSRMTHSQQQEATPLEHRKKRYISNGDVF